jgi:hypothetical protein
VGRDVLARDVDAKPSKSRRLRQLRWSLCCNKPRVHRSVHHRFRSFEIRQAAGPSLHWREMRWRPFHALAAYSLYVGGLVRDQDIRTKTERLAVNGTSINCGQGWAGIINKLFWISCTGLTVHSNVKFLLRL